MISEFFIRVKAFFKSIGHAALGIITELVLSFVLISVGLAVCIFWWGVLR